MSVDTLVRESTAAAQRRAGLGAALVWEVRKLAAQWRTRCVLIGAVVAPIPIAFAIHAQGNPPKDTLFGRYATTNGFALALLVLGYAGQWALPLLTAIVAGDIFASEDHHGTWKTILTRSVGRTPVFVAKTIVALGFGLLAVALLGLSVTVSSTLVAGHGDLIGLSGQLIPEHDLWRLVAESWANALVPTVAFTAIAILLGVWSRSAAFGVAAPVALGFTFQLVGAIGGAEGLRPYLPSTAYEAWHGFLAQPVFTGPFVAGVIASAVWAAASLALAWTIIRRRDITGG
jgi:ABC-2 type transport system permease protein